MAIDTRMSIETIDENGLRVWVRNPNYGGYLGDKIKVEPRTYVIGLFSPGSLPQNRSYRSSMSVSATSCDDAITKAKELTKKGLVFHYEVMQAPSGNWDGCA